MSLPVLIALSCGGGGGGGSEDGSGSVVNPLSAANNPPVMVAIGDKFVTEGEPLVFSVSAVDPDNDLLAFNAAPLPNGATFEDQEFSWQPAVGEVGAYQITFEVGDNRAQPLSDSEIITIWVEPSPGPDPSDEMEYGATGPYTLEVESFVNPAWPLGVPASVLLPAERTGPVPVLFFSHGLLATDWHSYSSLLTHLVSWGFAVVFSPYPTWVENMSERHQILWNGFKEASEIYGSAFNLHEVGFLGHSMGGGATPAMAWKGLVEEGWGDQGAFMFIMAPWYSYEISDAQLAAFPEHVNLIMQVYDQDEICDHRMAIDIFDHISVPLSRKSYCNVPHGSHNVPTEREINDLDRFAVAALLDALIDYTFEIDRPAGGKAYALEGLGQHFYHTITKNPVPVADESHYLSPWSSQLNPRHR